MGEISVLLLEDDLDLLHSLSVYLKGRGVVCYTASNISDAWQYINKAPDLLLLDLHLGNGEDGLEFYENVKTKYPLIKCILMTGYDTLPLRLKTFAVGASDYMKKPIFPAELYARIRRSVSEVISKSVCTEPSVSNLLTPKEEELFATLLRAQGDCVSKEALMAVVGSENALYVTFSRMKRRLPPNYRISTRYGRGWRLEVL